MDMGGSGEKPFFFDKRVQTNNRPDQWVKPVVLKKEEPQKRRLRIGAARGDNVKLNHIGYVEGRWDCHSTKSTGDKCSSQSYDTLGRCEILNRRYADLHSDRRGSSCGGSDIEDDLIELGRVRRIKIIDNVADRVTRNSRRLIASGAVWDDVSCSKSIGAGSEDKYYEY